MNYKCISECQSICDSESIDLRLGNSKPKGYGTVTAHGIRPGVLVDTRSSVGAVGPGVALVNVDGVDLRAAVINDEVVRHNAVATHHR